MGDALKKVQSGERLKIPAATAIVKKPAAAYIEKVYEEGDFSGLGIGV